MSCKFFSPILLLLLLLAGVVPQDGLAQQRQGTLDSIRIAYRNLEYARALQRAEFYLAEHPRVPETQLLTVLQYMAMSQLALGREQDARETLRSILVTNPSYQLDQRIVSPKLQTMYRQLRQAQDQSDRNQPASVRYVVKEDVYTEATLRTLIFPGLGQRHLDQHRWYVYSGLAGLSLAGFGYAALKLSGAHESYLEATKPEVIDDRYATYNRYYRLRNTAIASYLATWAIATTDILLQSRTPDTSPQISLHGSLRSLSFTIQW